MHERTRSIRRRIAALAVVAVALVSMTGCIDGIHLVGGGWFQDPGPSNPITVDNGIGVDVPGATALINRAAGTTIMVPVAGGGRVSFQQQTPIIDPNGLRHAMWVQWIRTGTEPYVNRCIVHYDPTFYNGWVVYWGTFAISHELGHCLDYPDVQVGQLPDYRGAMSYDNWGDPAWQGAYWWQRAQDDGALLQRDGYGP